LNQSFLFLETQSSPPEPSEPHVEGTNARSLRHNSSWRLPLLFGLTTLLGMWAGYRLHSGGPLGPTPESGAANPIQEVLSLIKQVYVDPVSVDTLHKPAIDALLAQLDPFSSYLPAEDLQAANEPLEGSFEGIGVEFTRLNDSVLVVASLSGGPSEQAGIRAGDKIVEVDGKPLVGPDLTNQMVIRQLRGKKGSRVKLGIFRSGQPSLLQFTVVRDKIPIYSLDLAYHIKPGTAYIRLNKFAASTMQEFGEAFDRLNRQQKIERLILDLRGNPGGYLNAATDLADEFLDGNKLITYTEGRTKPREEFKASRMGRFEQGKLLVLIDEGSASASEIIAGSVQDWDRGLLIGRRSFGKGTVQEQFDLKGGAGLRLTVARYYTPSGRCIQKPYDDLGLEWPGDEDSGDARGSVHVGDAGNSRNAGYAGGKKDPEDVVKEGYDGKNVGSGVKKSTGDGRKAKHSPASDTTRYRTAGGRSVFAGGGIMPDSVVREEGPKPGSLLYSLISSGELIRYSYYCSDRYRKKLTAAGSAAGFAAQNSLPTAVLGGLPSFVQLDDFTPNAPQWKSEQAEIAHWLKAYLGRQLYNSEGFYRVLHRRDPVLQRALQVLGQ
jgi:carboxyl-terminal processing protease